MRSTHFLNVLMVRLAMRDYSRFRTQMPRAREIQDRIIKRIVSRNVRSKFGALHGFSNITNYKSFRKNISISDYEDYRPYVQQMDRSESRILTAEKTLLFEPTSGSTSPTKFIPYTRGLRKEFFRAINPWLVDVYRRRPELLSGRSYWSISPPVTQSHPMETSVPVGFETDSAYLSRFSRRLVERTFVTSQALKSEREVKGFCHRLSVCLLAAGDLALVSVWNPTAFLILLDYIRAERESLLDALEKGFPRDSERFIPPSPERCRTLRRLFAHNPVPFSEVWPNLSFISCWADGANRTYVERLRSLFPDTEIQGKGLVATEGIISIPFAGKCYVPAYQSHFFEFLPEGEEKECCLLHELSIGGSYRVVLTTSGGFYRYLLGDVVTVSGQYDGLPLLQFVSRDKVLDHFGEKLHVGHVQPAVTRAVASLGREIAFLLFGFELTGDDGFYCLYLEMAEVMTAALQEKLRRERDNLTASLHENFHYAHALGTRQLRPLRIFVIDGGGTEAYFQRLSERGTKVGDIKTEAVSLLSDWSKFFLGSYLT